MVLLRNGKTDVNTSSNPDDLKMIGEQLTAMVAATSPKVTITMYSDMPAGQIGLSQMWSGDIINAQSYLPEGTGPEMLRYWFPADGKGLVDNDLMVDPQGRQEPGAVAPVPQPHARTRQSAKQNFTQIGYQPPQNSINPDTLVADGLHPREPEVGDRQARVLRRRIPPARTRRRQ